MTTGSKPTLEEMADKIASSTHTLLECYGPPNTHGCPLYKNILDALRWAVAEERRALRYWSTFGENPGPEGWRSAVISWLDERDRS